MYKLEIGDVYSVANGWNERDEPNPHSTVEIVGFCGPNNWPIIQKIATSPFDTDLRQPSETISPLCLKHPDTLRPVYSSSEQARECNV